MKRWRLRFKQKLVQAFGGGCAICGYSRCLAALEAHHLDPGEKEFAMARVTANPAAWARVAVELRKCVLLCSNCHAEVHYEGATVPEGAQRFDESLVAPGPDP